MSTMIELDGRSRVTLPGKAGRRYLVHEEADGVLVLEPAVVISEAERRYLADPAVQASVQYAREHPEEARPRAKRTTTS
jgi:hypothetical protein